MRDFKEYKDGKFKCPHCGAKFEFDEQEFTDSDPQGWNEYRHECECGEVVRYFEVWQFSHYEVYDD